jgi:hypothetical protein
MSTAVCRHFRNTGKCKFGDECKYQHSAGDAIASPPRGPCNNYRQGGECKFGDRCRYLHGETDPRFDSSGALAKPAASGETKSALARKEVKSAQASADPEQALAPLQSVRAPAPVSNLRSRVGNDSGKLLCIDGLNYARDFFCGKPNNVANALAAVSAFVAAARASGFAPEVFLDAQSDTQETIFKWRKRREQEVRTGQRGVMQGTTELLGDCFRENKVPVHYSVTDNDDTIASHASWRRGDVLSRDRDMFRYTPSGRFQVFSTFSVYRGRLTLQRHEQTTAKSSARAMAPAPLETQAADPMLIALLHSRHYLRGMPSKLVKTKGNTHETFRPLRQALYHQLQLSHGEQDEKFMIKEEFPTWNGSDVEWSVTEVVPDATYLDLLSDPAEAVRTFGRLDKNDDKDHVLATWMVALEIVRSANPQGPSLLRMFLETPGSPGAAQKATSKAIKFRGVMIF